MHKKHEMSCKGAKMAKGMKKEHHKKKAHKHSKEDLMKAAKHMHEHMR